MADVADLVQAVRVLHEAALIDDSERDRLMSVANETDDGVAELVDAVAERAGPIAQRGTEGEATEDEVAVVVAAATAIQGLEFEQALRKQRRERLMSLAASAAKRIEGTERPSAPPRSASVQRVQAHRGERHQPRATATAPEWSPIVASGGTPLDGVDGVHAAFVDAIKAGARSDVTEARTLVASVKAIARNGSAIGADAHDPDGLRALTAAASAFCGPPQVIYDFVTVAEASRPVKDALGQVLAARGQIQYPSRPILLSDIPTSSSAVSGVNVSVYKDSDYQAGTLKGVAEVTCPTWITTHVDAVVRRVRFANFQAMYLPTLIAGWLETLLAAHAKVAETKLLTDLDALSMAVTSAAELSSTRDLLDVVSKVTEQYESTYRLPDSTRWLMIAPGWLGPYLATDISRQAVAEPYDSLAVGDGEISRWFNARADVDVVESPERQPLAALTAGAVPAWPSTVTVNLIPAGSTAFIDGGVLDLGVIRDSALVSANKAELFAETMEAVAVLGLQPIKLTATLCPSGSVAGSTAATGLCT